MLEELGALASLVDGDTLGYETRPGDRPDRQGIAPRSPALAGYRSMPLVPHAQVAASQAASIAELGEALERETVETLSMARELATVSASLLGVIGAIRARRAKREPSSVNAAIDLDKLDRHASRLDCLGRRLSSRLHGLHGHCRTMSSHAAIAATTTKVLCGQVESELDRSRK